MFCSKCGTNLPVDADYCPECGKKVNIGAVNSERIIEYRGKIVKCPNCGKPLNSFEMKCESCGYEIRCTTENSSIKLFEDNLRQLDNTRQVGKKSTLGQMCDMYNLSADVTDVKLANHIKTFPIPNTKEDIMEFLILALSNINFAAYEFGSGLTPSEFTGRKLIDQAWISKFEQAYQKAKIAFPEDQIIIGVKNQFDAKKKSKIIGFVIRIFLFVFFILFFIVLLAVIFRYMDNRA